jgi:hypothetical protein
MNSVGVLFLHCAVIVLPHVVKLIWRDVECAVIHLGIGGFDENGLPEEVVLDRFATKAKKDADMARAA